MERLATKGAVNDLTLRVDEDIIGDSVNQIDGSSRTFPALQIGYLQPRHLELIDGFDPSLFLLVERHTYVERFYEDLQDLLELTAQKDVLFIIGDWNAKVGSQEIQRITGKFGLGVQNEAGQRLIEFCQENALVIANTLFQQPREDSTHGHQHMVNNKIRLILFFAAKDGEALYISKNKTGS